MACGFFRRFSARSRCLTNFKHSNAKVLPLGGCRPASGHLGNVRSFMRITPLALPVLCLLAATPARADLHITLDHGGYVTEYKAKYERIRDRKERVIID